MDEELRKVMDKKLYFILKGIMDSESNEGCDSTLTVVEAKYIRQLRRYIKDHSTKENPHG